MSSIGWTNRQLACCYFVRIYALRSWFKPPFKAERTTISITLHWRLARISPRAKSTFVAILSGLTSTKRGWLTRLKSNSPKTALLTTKNCILKTLISQGRPSTYWESSLSLAGSTKSAVIWLITFKIQFSMTKSTVLSFSIEMMLKNSQTKTTKNINTATSTFTLSWLRSTTNKLPLKSLIFQKIN